MMDLDFRSEQLVRRAFLGRASLGLGSVALAGLLQPRVLAAATKVAGVRPGPKRYHGVVNPLHFVQKAKRVIFLCMSGGPSQLELFDDKPKLAAMHGQPVPESYTKGQPIAQLQNQKLLCFGSQSTFGRFGKSGQAISNYLPHIGSIADDICIVRLDANGANQSRSGPHFHEHGDGHLGPAEHGLVGYVRPGKRIGRPAGFCRPRESRRHAPAATGRLATMV